MQKKLDEQVKLYLGVEEQKITNHSQPQSSGELLNRINSQIKKGEQIQDPFLKYCLAHFIGKNIRNVGTNKVREFLITIRESVASSIRVTYERLESETGIISEPCKFLPEGLCTKLYVPVERSRRYYKKITKQKQKKIVRAEGDGEIYIPHEIFLNKGGHFTSEIRFDEKPFQVEIYTGYRPRYGKVRISIDHSNIL